MKQARIPVGWYKGHIAEIHPTLGLASLQPATGGFSIPVPLYKFAVLWELKPGSPVEFFVTPFGGVAKIRRGENHAHPGQ